MKKVYTYEKKYFNIEVLLTGIISILVSLISLVMMVLQFLTPLFVILFVVCVYQIVNTFFTNSNPREIEVTDKTLSLSSFNIKDTYELKQIKSFRVREFPRKAKAYVRINKKGRYWIQTYRMNDGDELYDWLLTFEQKIHPDSLKARAKQFDKSKKK